jgi:FkbM family methyltransferase
MVQAFGKATASENVTFVQVGSNDGTTGDPLRAVSERFHWRGVLVEPVPYVYDRLRAMRGANRRLSLENVAVADRDGTASFSHLKRAHGNEDVPVWYDQLGSFSLEILLSHEDEIPNLRERLITTDVETVTFDTLCARHGIDRLDLIHVDTEGYDWEILRRIDLRRYQPSLLLFEHRHLRAADLDACRDFLDDQGYVRRETADDTICLSRTALTNAHLRRAWARIAKDV